MSKDECSIGLGEDGSSSAERARIEPHSSILTSTLCQSEERIVAAAHLYRNAHDPEDSRAQPVIVSAPPPARHHNLFIAWDRLGSPSESGFLTSTGRFVDRVEAWEIATGAGQEMLPREGQGRRLFSEDLW